MADRQWFVEGVQVHEEGEEEYFVEGVQLVEDQADMGGNAMPMAIQHYKMAGAL